MYDRRRDLKRLLVLLAIFGVILTALVVPGVFIIDDVNYLVNVVALRQGHLTIANTAGLPPSRELLYFDPGPWSRTVASTPVASTAPPLWAFIALPFSWIGWRGLVALNTLAFLATIAMVFLFVRNRSRDNQTPLLAAVVFALCGYSIEYAIGLWPHSLSVALCTAGIFLAVRVFETPSPALVCGSGLLLGFATGVRYQNALILAVVGGGLLLWSRPRSRMAAWYSVAALLPLTASALINQQRLGSWNPISKGLGYLSVPILKGEGRSWFEPLTMLWARVVDYSARPVPKGLAYDGWFVHDPLTGVNLMFGLVQKKALLQSAPWVLLAFVLFFVVWLPKSRMDEKQRRPLRLFSMISFATLIAFSASGARRDDGLTFNQRYFLELMPLMAIGFASAFEGTRLRREALWLGAMIGVYLIAIILIVTPDAPGSTSLSWIVGHLSLRRIPLFLAATLVIAVLVWTQTGRRGTFLAAVAGASLGWAFMLHLGDDVLHSRNLRLNNYARANFLKAHVPDGAALVAFGGLKDAVGPLLLERDVVVLDPRADGMSDAPMLIRELLHQGRRVLFFDHGLPAQIRVRCTMGFSARLFASAGLMTLTELSLSNEQLSRTHGASRSVFPENVARRVESSCREPLTKRVEVRIVAS